MHEVVAGDWMGLAFRRSDGEHTRPGKNPSSNYDQAVSRALDREDVVQPIAGGGGTQTPS